VHVTDGGAEIAGEGSEGKATDVLWHWIEQVHHRQLAIGFGCLDETSDYPARSSS
jgi:hypothetical protein